MSQIAGRWRRRLMLTSGVAAMAVWVVGLPRLLGGGRSTLRFRDMPDLPPFQMLETTGTVSGAGLLTGLDTSATPDPGEAALIASIRADPCVALFSKQSDPRLPIAFFSDFNCPNCRTLNAVLIAYDDKNPGTIRIIRHELPLLGASSITASEAVLAADLQGGYTAMHDRLMRALMVTDLNYVERMAQSVGLDGHRLLADMQSPEVETALSKSRAIAKLFGFYGTPSTVIGRKAFLGSISAADVEQIIETELAAPMATCSAG